MSIVALCGTKAAACQIVGEEERVLLPVGN